MSTKLAVIRFYPILRFMAGFIKLVPIEKCIRIEFTGQDIRYSYSFVTQFTNTWVKRIKARKARQGKQKPGQIKVRVLSFYVEAQIGEILVIIPPRGPFVNSWLLWLSFQWISLRPCLFFHKLEIELVSP